MASEIDRRRFLKDVALTGAAIWLGGAESRAQDSKPPSEKLNIGVIGVANQGRYDLDNVRSQNIVALCDIDDNYLAAAAKDLPDAKLYNDYRKMLAQKDIEAVVIATPDHTHAPATLLALESGRHVYCEKPLTHTVAEARQVAETARRHKRVTQMGTQIHASSNYRRVVEIVQSGAIGEVREVHCWVGTIWSGQGRPAETPPVPSNLHWDLWLNVAPVRPYNPVYLPASWRGWWDFGGGGLADMACHHIDLPTWALDLRAPETVEAEGPPVDPENAPPWMIVRYAYPARDTKPPVALTWYHGGKRPPYFAEGRLPEWGDGTLFVGSKGMLLADYGRHVLLPEKDFAGFQPPPPTIPDSIGHHLEWIEACKTGGTTTCNFDYAGALTETVLLGNVAYRLGKKITWDARRLRAIDCPEADAYLKPHYRKEWINRIEAA
jgi:predicted dehydrogenase